MKRIAVAALAAAGVAAFAAPASAGAAPTLTGPCAEAQFLMNKYGIHIEWYAPEVERALSTVCGITH